LNKLKFFRRLEAALGIFGIQTAREKDEMTAESSKFKL
jgi:hypothetical protein